MKKEEKSKEIKGKKFIYFWDLYGSSSDGKYPILKLLQKNQKEFHSSNRRISIEKKPRDSGFI